MQPAQTMMVRTSQIFPENPYDGAYTRDTIQWKPFSEMEAPVFWRYSKDGGGSAPPDLHSKSFYEAEDAFRWMTNSKRHPLWKKSIPTLVTDLHPGEPRALHTNCKPAVRKTPTGTRA